MRSLILVSLCLAIASGLTAEAALRTEPRPGLHAAGPRSKSRHWRHVLLGSAAALGIGALVIRPGAEPPKESEPRTAAPTVGKVEIRPTPRAALRLPLGSGPRARLVRDLDRMLSAFSESRPAVLSRVLDQLASVADARDDASKPSAVANGRSRPAFEVPIQELASLVAPLGDFVTRLAKARSASGDVSSERWTALAELGVLASQLKLMLEPVPVEESSRDRFLNSDLTFESPLTAFPAEPLASFLQAMSASDASTDLRRAAVHAFESFYAAQRESVELRPYADDSYYALDVTLAHLRDFASLHALERCPVGPLLGLSEGARWREAVSLLDHLRFRAALPRGVLGLATRTGARPSAADYVDAPGKFDRDVAALRNPWSVAMAEWGSPQNWPAEARSASGDPIFRVEQEMGADGANSLIWISAADLFRDAGEAASRDLTSEVERMGNRGEDDDDSSFRQD